MNALPRRINEKGLAKVRYAIPRGIHSHHPWCSPTGQATPVQIGFPADLSNRGLLFKSSFSTHK